MDEFRMDPRSQDFCGWIGEALKEKGLLDDHALTRVRRAHQETGERFDHILTRLGLVSEVQLAATLSDLLGMKLVSKSDYPVTAVETRLPIKFLKTNRLIPISESDERIHIAMADPFNRDAVDAIAYLTDKAVVCSLTLNADFDMTIERLYEEPEVRSEGDGYAGDSYSSEDDVERLRDIASEAPVIQLVNQLINQAVEQGVSDIHIEPQENAVRVRFRLDGVLTEIQSLPLSLQSAVTSRIKILGKLNIAERRLPQDGRIRIAVRGQDIDIRLSTTPTYYGESVVMRILDQGLLSLNFSSLGFYGDALEKYKNLLAEPNGIILVTGPTGSGKTTTLYASLSSLDSDTQKIFTVEDPIEYQLRGINQLQVHSKVGLTFATALRSILRQDPDVIMIGEIRDLETAQIAIQSSLTGHLVLSTLHTNSAAATITRLLDMGVEDYLLASTIKGIMAQRLVRRLCEECAEPLEVKENFIEKLAPEARTLETVASMGGLNIRGGRGCEVCNHTGFRGRTTIMELLTVDEAMQDLVLASGSQSRIEQTAIEAGMRTMYQDGLVKAFRGETTLEEVLRLTRSL